MYEYNRVKCLETKHTILTAAAAVATTNSNNNHLQQCICLDL